MHTPRIVIANSHDPDMRYAVPLFISDPFVWVECDGKQFVLVSALELGVAQTELADSGISVVSLSAYIEKAKAQRARDPSIPSEGALALSLFEEFGLMQRKVLVSSRFPLSTADVLRAAGATLVVERSLFPERDIKSSTEIEHIRNALVRTQKAFAFIEDVLRASTIASDETLFYQDELLTSEWLKREVELLLFKEGLLSTDGLIISSGGHAAIPHHSGAGPIRAHSPIVCDLFPRDRARGYFADMTRTYWKGAPTEQYRTQYKAVLAAQEAALALLAHGAIPADVHRACVNVFAAHGFETTTTEGFIHSTGHGIGIELHESPSLTPHNTTPLALGNVVTVEPGLYYSGEQASGAGLGGVRIEDVAVVTGDGYINLTDYPKDFDASVIA